MLNPFQVGRLRSPRTCESSKYFALYNSVTDVAFRWFSAIFRETRAGYCVLTSYYSKPVPNCIPIVFPVESTWPSPIIHAFQYNCTPVCRYLNFSVMHLLEVF
jgi:hypothetical protein